MKWKQKAWKMMSQYIRQKDAENGIATCVTCGTSKRWQEMDAGHFIPKSRGNAVFFEETNVHVQCKGCNMVEGGRFEDYYPWMVKTYGQEEVDRLTALGKTIRKMKDYDFQEIYDYYRIKLNELPES